MIHGILVDSCNKELFCTESEDTLMDDIYEAIGKPVGVATVGLPYEFWFNDSGDFFGQHNSMLEALTGLEWYGPGVILKRTSDGQGYVDMYAEASRFVMSGGSRIRNSSNDALA